MSREMVKINESVVVHVENVNKMVTTQQQKHADFAKEHDKKVSKLVKNQDKLIGDQSEKLDLSIKSQEAKVKQLIGDQAMKIADLKDTVYFDAHR